MIYTSYDMIRDCRADQPEGWSYFVTHYVPVIRRLLAHYVSDDPRPLESVLLSLRNPESSLFQSMEPSPERWFVAELRQQVVPTDTAPAADAATPLTLVEKQVVRLRAMRYGSDEIGVMLKMSPATVDSIIEKAGGFTPGPSARTEACLPAKAFLDVIDGRSNWYTRNEMDRHVNGCWHCIDHFCRLREVCELLRQCRPLTDEEAAPFKRLFGIGAERSSLFKKLFSAR